MRCIERAEGGAIVAGPAGTGKSLLCQVIADQFRGKFDVVYLANGRLATRRALLQAMLFELAMPYRGMEEGELRLSLIDRLSTGAPTAQDAPSQGMLLLVDEAHLLPLRLLEEIRMITDLARQGESRVRLMLVGAPLLEERLASPRLYALQQRITTRCYLEPLDRAETADYVRRRIAGVGGQVDAIFTPSALDSVYRATEGIPRLINQTCDHALVLAAAGGVKPIDAAGIDEAWADLQQLPTPWSRQPGTSMPVEATTSSVEFGTLDDSTDGEAQLVDDIAAGLMQQPLQAREPLPTVLPVDAELPLGPAERMLRDPDETLDSIASHLADLESDYTPAPMREPEVELFVGPTRRDPFVESFAEEVVVVDRYGRFDPPIEGSQAVACDESAALGAQLNAAASAVPRPVLRVTAEGVTKSTRTPAAPATTSVKPAATATAAALEAPRYSSQWDPVEPEGMFIVPRRPTSDADMIIIEDDPHVGAATDAEAKPVRKQDFRQMFQRLRRGP